MAKRGIGTGKVLHESLMHDKAIMWFLTLQNVHQQYYRYLHRTFVETLTVRRFHMSETTGFWKLETANQSNQTIDLPCFL